jgi:hypothetical protein
MFVLVDQSGQTLAQVAVVLAEDGTVSDVRGTIMYPTYLKLLQVSAEDKAFFCVLTRDFLLIESISKWYQDGLKPQRGNDPAVVDEELRTLMAHIKRNTGLRMVESNEAITPSPYWTTGTFWDPQPDPMRTR